MKYLKHFANAQEAATILATWPFNTISSIQGQEGASFSEGVPVGPEPGPEPVGPTDRVILKFMVTADDWNEDAGKYQKMLIDELSEQILYDGSCFDYMIKDNERIDENFWSKYLYFDTTGEHTVEFIFDEEFDGELPGQCFWGAAIYEAVIPSCVTYIGFEAFSGCTSLTSLTIPDTVTGIGSNAIQSCSSLISITCNAIIPPTCVYGAFDNTNDCPIYVPASSVDAYKVAENWTYYASRIQAIQS